MAGVEHGAEGMGAPAEAATAPLRTGRKERNIRMQEQEGKHSSSREPEKEKTAAMAVEMRGVQMQKMLQSTSSTRKKGRRERAARGREARNCKDARGAAGKRKEVACTGNSGESEGGIHSTPIADALDGLSLLIPNKCLERMPGASALASLATTSK